MRGIQTLALGVALLSSFSEALTLQRRQDGPPKVLGMDIQRRAIADPVKRDQIRRLGRRDGTVQASLDNEVTLYFANISIGTPAQRVKLHIDTGSSDLWVNTVTSKLCKTSTNCGFAGTYTANSSSTYAYVAGGFKISYVDGSGASGDYVTDTVMIGNSTIKAQQFGIGYTSSSAEGILGIGYAINEATSAQGLTPYSNVPASMVTQGLISSQAYSLWLNDLDASTGSILFGGVDTAKYVGTLSTLPVQKEQGYFAEFLITLTGITLGTTTIASSADLAVLLDSGTSLTYLPDDMVEAIYNLTGAQYDSQEGAAIVPCSLASSTQTLEFQFTTPIITVAMGELVLPIIDSNGAAATFTDGTQACLFGIAPSGSGTAVLGDTFMRSAYIVYDLANNEISIAQTDFSATATNVLEIVAGASGVPNASPVSDAATATTGSGSQSTLGGSVTLGTSGNPASGASSTGVGMLALVALGLGTVFSAL